MMTISSSDQNVTGRLRADLKAAGWSARQVSVRCPHTSIYVTIRDADVSRTAVTTIAKRYEVVYRDVGSDDVLSGGTFVHVDYLPALYADLLTKVAAKLRATERGQRVELLGGFRAARAGEPAHLDPFWLTGPGLGTIGANAYGIAEAAKCIAITYLDVRALDTVLP